MKNAILIMLYIFSLTPAYGQSAGSPFFYRIGDVAGVCDVDGVEAGDCGDNVVWTFSDNNQGISTADTASMIPTDSLPDIPGYGTTERIEYGGNTVYRNGKLYKVLFPGGYCTFENGSDSPTFHYFTQDHLGNNRVVTNEDGTVEQITHYYPFGGPFGDAGLNPELQPYKYNGKELDRMFGLDTYDYGARQYFPALPVWDRMDPLCEIDYNISQYAYCKNSPMLHIDKDGEKTVLYATTLPGGPKLIPYPTHTFVVVFREGYAPEYFAYGPEGDYSGPLRRVFYEQDIAVYSGEDQNHLKNKIVIEPPKGKSERSFDEDVINAAKSFGNQDGVRYKLLPLTDTEGNCNTSSSTLLYKSGISEEQLKHYKKEIKGIVSGFGNIKPWTEEEQKKAINEKNIIDKIYEWFESL